MKLASIDNGRRDGELIVVSKDLKRFVQPRLSCGSTMQSVLDQWDLAKPELEKVQDYLNRDSKAGEALNFEKLLAPLPRAYEWIDGSAYLNHVRLVRKARGAEMPDSFLTDPLVYQGGSGIMLRWNAPLEFVDDSWGLDFESEIAVILGDVPRGAKAADASKYIRFLCLVNDVSLRGLIPNELAKGFGFFNSKPASAFAPIIVTPDEVADFWRDGRLHLPVHTNLNGKKFGDPNAGPEMQFSFGQLIEHVAKTRGFVAGTILGSGTVSNEDRARGSSCLAEIRMIEQIDSGKATTPFLKPGDRVEIEVKLPDGQTVFGRIDQLVTQR